MSNYGLGRKPAADDRDFLLQPRTTTDRRYRYWHDREAFLDQNGYPHCVGYSWTHWLNDGPVARAGFEDNNYADNLYFNAQLVDEWPGENYSGSSVRAGAKVLHQFGYISEYRFGHDLQTVVHTLLNEGPVVAGTNWYSTMFTPDAQGFLRIHPDAKVEGGHAYVLNGVNLDKGVVRVKNSWGTSWGLGGRAKLDFETLERLINEDGECCLAIERKTNG